MLVYFARPEHLLDVVLDFITRNVTEKTLSGFKATDAAWLISQDLRAYMFEEVRKAWCQKVQRDYTWFPYSEDFVVRIYNRYCGWSAKDIKVLKKDIDGLIA